jgi:hypothetical protein
MHWIMAKTAMKPRRTALTKQGVGVADARQAMRVQTSE